MPFPTPGHLPNAGIEPTSLTSPALAGRFFTTSAIWEGRPTVHTLGKPGSHIGWRSGYWVRPLPATALLHFLLRRGLSLSSCVHELSTEASSVEGGAGQVGDGRPCSCQKLPQTALSWDQRDVGARGQLSGGNCPLSSPDPFAHIPLPESQRQALSPLCPSR